MVHKFSEQKLGTGWGRKEEEDVRARKIQTHSPSRDAGNPGGGPWNISLFLPPVLGCLLGPSTFLGGLG